MFVEQVLAEAWCQCCPKKVLVYQHHFKASLMSRKRRSKNGESEVISRGGGRLHILGSGRPATNTAGLPRMMTVVHARVKRGSCFSKIDLLEMHATRQCRCFQNYSSVHN